MIDLSDKLFTVGCLVVSDGYRQDGWQCARTKGMVSSPSSSEITSCQPYVGATAAELNKQPRAVLECRTPREVFGRLILGGLASAE